MLKKMRNKGFTLIELLAVIIILAIIALITTPIILNVVNDARKSAAQDKAWGTIDAVRLAFTQNQTATDSKVIIINSTNGVTTGFSATGLACLGAAIAPSACGDTQTPIKMSGDKPKGGQVVIESTGIITIPKASALNFGSHKCYTSADGNTMTCE